MTSASAEKVSSKPASQDPAQPSNPLLEFTPDRLHAAYRDKDFDGMCRQFLEVLDHLRGVTYYAMDVPTTYALNGFVKQLLYFFSRKPWRFGIHRNLHIRHIRKSI